MLYIIELLAAGIYFFWINNENSRTSKIVQSWQLTYQNVVIDVVQVSLFVTSKRF